MDFLVLMVTSEILDNDDKASLLDLQYATEPANTDRLHWVVF